MKRVAVYWVSVLLVMCFAEWTYLYIMAQGSTGVEIFPESPEEIIQAPTTPSYEQYVGAYTEQYSDKMPTVCMNMSTGACMVTPEISNTMVVIHHRGSDVHVYEVTK